MSEMEFFHGYFEESELPIEPEDDKDFTAEYRESYDRREKEKEESSKKAMDDRMSKCVFKWVEKRVFANVFDDVYIPPLGKHGDYYSDFNIYQCETCGKIRVDAE